MASLTDTDEIVLLKACALEYRGGRAPHIKAYGVGLIAKQIVEIAKKLGIPVEKGQTKELLDALGQIHIDTAIPPALYLAVARIYVHILSRSTENEM